MVGYVYITFNLINSKFYAGIHKRKTFTENYLGSGLLIKKAIEKYGKYNFTVLEVVRCNTLEELNKAEIYWIKEFKRIYGEQNCYNIQIGGNIPTNKGKPISEEQKLKLRELRIGKCKEQNGMYGRHHTDESKTIMSNKKKGLYDGCNNPNFSIKRRHMWLGNVHKYVKETEIDTYLKQGFIFGPSCNKSKVGTNKNHYVSEETKLKISKSQKIRLNKNKL